MKNWIKKWLELDTQDRLETKLEKKVDDWIQDKLQHEVEHWKRLFKSYSEITCTVCGKTIITYPFGGGYYREADGSVVCSNECLDKKAFER